MLLTPTRVAALARGLLLAAALAASALAAPARALEPFAADYRATYMGISADASMSLEPQGGDRWKCTLDMNNPIAQMTRSPCSRTVTANGDRCRAPTRPCCW